MVTLIQGTHAKMPPIIVVEPEFERTPDAFVVHELVLVPAAQRAGLGTELLRAAQEWAEDRELPVLLRVLRENRAARLYRRLGFQPCGESDTHISLRWQPS